MNKIRLNIILAIGGTFVLICSVLLDLLPNNLNTNSIIFQSLGIVGASYLVSTLIHLFITKQMGKNTELLTVYAWLSNLAGFALVVNGIVSL